MIAIHPRGCQQTSSTQSRTNSQPVATVLPSNSTNEKLLKSSSPLLSGARSCSHTHTCPLYAGSSCGLTMRTPQGKRTLASDGNGADATSPSTAKTEKDIMPHQRSSRPQWRRARLGSQALYPANHQSNASSLSHFHSVAKDPRHCQQLAFKSQRKLVSLADLVQLFDRSATRNPCGNLVNFIDLPFLRQRCRWPGPIIFNCQERAKRVDRIVHG